MSEGLSPERLCGAAAWGRDLMAKPSNLRGDPMAKPSICAAI